MPIRLVIAQDLIDHPELTSQGISANMNYDFPEPTKEESQETPKPATKRKATKDTHKPIPKKQKAKSK